ncbi:MAG: penicillin-binding transpeptidase domain-containing protein, partial [Myxococcota bacterium]
APEGPTAAAPQAPLAPNTPAAAEDDGDDAHPMATVPLTPQTGAKVSPEWRRALSSLQTSRGAVLASRVDRRATTTMRADVQEAAENILKDYDVPAGAVVVMEPRTGRILAATGFSEDGQHGRELALLPVAPAASVFKIVTGAALLEKGVSAEHQVCFSGGKRRVRSRDLKANANRDRHCATFAQAMAKSANIPFARMTDEFLSSSDLTRWASRFLFNTNLPLDVPASPARIPANPGIELAATGAGFGDVRMSALHGAMLVSAVANDGVMPVPVLWEGDAPKPGHRVMDARAAAALQDMLEMTVTEGTAKRAFRERRRYALGDIAAAGKTGSLAEQGPFRDYSWFVGYAPADKPTVAVSVFVMNHAQWRIRASYVGREVLKTALVKGHKPYRPTLDVARR